MYLTICDFFVMSYINYYEGSFVRKCNYHGESRKEMSLSRWKREARS